MTEQAVHAIGRTVQVVDKTAHAVEKTAHVVDEVVQVARQEGVDWATLKEAAVLAGTAAVKLVQWWLCGHGLHLWQEWEYDDGTALDECSSCGRQRVPEEAYAV